ncbi:hypothetical protein PHYSODRAFT_294723 [Phytophthora sojae]|uniref:Uncharacterized protein n=1 Tax=Phytophthora sojae (strain P6497) TaxID=1094619 RepID=G4YHW6_PHYSP|nr:hypothetical protein PHYSODRAFT_294723 [Phytophthora sojae]EGZ29693.1 hypothetical protein PHYSODRAFT_294723 [Phytophthora sojae]|eukprot:XP_009516968.1 hypothetical protein PHYSODRAFT_294723 [Phytophthora sojae]
MAYEDKSIAEVAVYEDESKPEPQLDGLTATSSELEAASATALKEALAKETHVLFLTNYYTTLVMPLWTYKELHRAVRALRAAGSSQVGGISDDVLETWFYTFGGLARECLLPSEDLVDVAKDGITREIHQIQCSGMLVTLQYLLPNSASLSNLRARGQNGY